MLLRSSGRRVGVRDLASVDWVRASVWLGVRLTVVVLLGNWEGSGGPGVHGREAGAGAFVGVWGFGRPGSGRDNDRVNVAPRVKPPTGVARLLLEWVSSSVEVSFPCLGLRGRSATVRADCDLCIAACLACARRVEARVGGGVWVRGRERIAGGVWHRVGSWPDAGGRLTPTL